MIKVCNVVPRFVLLLLLIFASGGEILAEGVDPTFNAQVQTSTFRPKFVRLLVPLPDGKTIAVGNFNTYNGTPVGGLIRLNADASLDTTFNNDVVAPVDIAISVKLRPDGKIVLGGNFSLADGTVYTNKIIRLNADGSLDNSFNYAATGSIYEVKIDASGRVLVSGAIQYVGGGGTISRGVVRLNDNGTIDAAFDAPNVFVEKFTAQGDKVVYTIGDISAQQSRLLRLNEDGTPDNTFASTLMGNFQILEMTAQPDRKILTLADNRIFRVNENGGLDGGFQVTNFPHQPRKAYLQPDGRITVAHGNLSPFGLRVIRVLPNGAPDPSFTPYVFTGNDNVGCALQSDGGVLIGDQSFDSTNRFMRLLPTGAPDGSFNPGGTGFLNVNPGKIRAISVWANGKILIGGDFDRVNSTPRTKIALLNADSTLDNSFQINTTATGNYFSQIGDVYNFAVQGDGKIIVSGNFTYFVNGVQKGNLVRLNANGSIDPAFNLSLIVPDWFLLNGLGKNEPLQMPSGKILIGTTRSSLSEPTTVPLVLNSQGAKDASFNPTIFADKNSVTIFDIALQPDGKILLAGRHVVSGVGGETVKGYVARLNADGTIDQTFQAYEAANRNIFAFALTSNGQILIVSRTNLQSEIHRLNADGTIDGSFNGGAGANGKINAVSILPDNKILLGGLFSTYNGEPRQNLAVLDADGTLNETAIGINREVLCIALDAQGRILIGGHFTSIRDNGQQISRSYLARLIASVTKPYFDFDGDGKTDLSVFRPSSGEWWYSRSSDSVVRAAQFGNSADRIAPADFTGDGKTDIAFFRPSSGEWFVLRSENASFLSFPFGAAGDVPAIGDFDADGKADPTVYRPSTNEWFILKSTGGTTITTFGAAGDMPVPADFDGDGKADIAIFRPSDGSWWYLRSIDAQYRVYRFGAPGDKPVPGDWTGDGKADLAVWRESTGEWFVMRSEDDSYYSNQFGAAGDIPAPGDYDGDGKFDTAVFRPSNAGWYVQRSTAGTLITNFGANGDRPVPNSFIP